MISVFAHGFCMIWLQREHRKHKAITRTEEETMRTQYLAGALVGTCALMSAAGASAAVLFNETFNNVSFSTFQTSKSGVPVQAGFGADANWHAARFEGSFGSCTFFGCTTPKSDVGAYRSSTFSSATKAGYVSDGAGLLLNVNASGFGNLTLDFDWRTSISGFFGGTSDHLTVGYIVGGIGTPNSAREFNQVNNWGAWTQVMRDRDDFNWNHESITLANTAGAESVWIAFWSDGMTLDFFGEGRIDNVSVTADPSAVIPVPAALPLFLSGIAGLLAMRRRVGR
ncbi:MAG: VPLPA-CTERM sorting domain-containing protein [Gammaproteobacteria bacterium]